MKKLIVSLLLLFVLADVADAGILGRRGGKRHRGIRRGNHEATSQVQESKSEAQPPKDAPKHKRMPSPAKV